MISLSNGRIFDWTVSLVICSWIATKIESLAPSCTALNPSIKLHRNPSLTFWVMLLTNRQTNRKLCRKHNLLVDDKYAVFIIYKKVAVFNFLVHIVTLSLWNMQLLAFFRVQSIPCTWGAVMAFAMRLECVCICIHSPVLWRADVIMVHNINLCFDICDQITLGKKATIHQLTTMLSTSKNVPFPGHNYLLTPVLMTLHSLAVRRESKCQVISTGG